MDYGAAFTYLPKSSEKWMSKALMGLVFALFVPFFLIGLIPLAGWAIAIARHVNQGDDDVLPEWSELSSIIIDGLKFIGLLIIWYIPFWFLSLLNLLVDDFLVILVNCCSIIYGIPFSILLVGAIGSLAGDRPYTEVLNPMNAFKVISANWASTLITWLMAVVTYFVAVAIGLVLCIVGVFLGITYGISVVGHLYGQLYRESQGSEKLAVA
jgi:hypothetical protein